MFTFIKTGNGCFIYKMPEVMDLSRTGHHVIAEAQDELNKLSDGLYEALHATRVALERDHRVTVVGAALVGAEGAPARPYFILECAYDWILTAISNDGRVSQSDMAGLVSMAGGPADAVERHNREWHEPWHIRYMELWEETI